jgi:hypothetical protein
MAGYAARAHFWGWVDAFDKAISEPLPHFIPNALKRDTSAHPAQFAPAPDLFAVEADDRMLNFNRSAVHAVSPLPFLG